MPQSITNIFKHHPREWLLIDVAEWDKATLKPIRGKVLAHSKNRDEIYNRLLKINKKNLPLVTYSSTNLPKGYAVALFSIKL